MKRPSKEIICLLIGSITRFFTTTKLMIFKVTFFHLWYFPNTNFASAELCSEECYVYIYIHILALKEMHEYMRIT